MAKDKRPASPLVAAAEAFDDSLRRFAALAEAADKGSLDSQKSLAHAGETLTAIAACEEELQSHAQALMAALGAARDAQQSQAEAVSQRALEIQKRTEDYAAVMRRFEALRDDSAALNASAQELAAGRRTAEELAQDGQLLAGLDELHERMAGVAQRAEQLARDARAADFEDQSRQVDSLRQQVTAARNKIGLLKEGLLRARTSRQPS